MHHIYQDLIRTVQRLHVREPGVPYFNVPYFTVPCRVCMCMRLVYRTSLYLTHRCAVLHCTSPLTAPRCARRSNPVCARLCRMCARRVGTWMPLAARW